VKNKGVFGFIIPNIPYFSHTLFTIKPILFKYLRQITYILYVLKDYFIHKFKFLTPISFIFLLFLLKELLFNYSLKILINSHLLENFLYLI
ncbi:hypothetical protein GW891_05655, partial [bacterium]|nr:hypothetical protein [bacterium]